MDGQDHRITATSVTAGHEGHGVHLCHRCGWPFPNPHPSAKHRRAHKRVCGTVEGYKIIHSEENDHHLAVSDYDNPSDDDEHHTPSPNIVKKNAGSNAREGGKSATLEDDVFSDAVTDFTDSGISPRLEERFENVRELGKNVEQKSVEGDLHGSETLEVKEASDSIEESNDTRSEEISKHGPLENGNTQPDNAVLITALAAKSVSVELTDDSQPKHGAGGSGHGEMIAGNDADFQVQEHGLASVTFNHEGEVLGPTIVAGESQDTLRDTLVPAVAKHNPPSPCEPLHNLDASEVINIVVNYAERGTSTKTFEVAPVDKSGESIDASVGVEEVSHYTESIGSTESAGENILHEESLLSSSLVRSNENTKIIDINKKGFSKASLDGGQTTGDFDASEEEKSDITGNKSLELKNLSSVDTNSTLNSTDNAFAFEDDNTKITKKNISHCGENINGTALGTGNENGEGTSVEVDVIPDYKLSSEKLTEFSGSYAAADSDAKSIQELWEHNSDSLEFKDDGLDKSIQSHGVDKVTEVLQSFGSAEAGFDVDHNIGDAHDKNSLQSFSLENTLSPVTSELSNNIHLAKDVPETPEDSYSKESASSLSNSLLLSRNTANEDNCIREDANTSESIATTEVTAKDHENNVEIREISESPAPSVQEASLDIKSHSSDHLSTSKFVHIIPSSALTFDGKASTSDGCSESANAVSEKQPVPLPSNVQEFHGTSDTVDKTRIKVEDASVDVKTVLPEVDDKSTKQTDDTFAIDVSESISSRSDSLEANCGSIVSDTLETITQKHKSLAEEVQPEKSDTFEPPSFMTLVQCGSEGDQLTAATEIEAEQNNQEPKSNALQAGWFPSLTNVVNESEGRKKNEEMIAKVTNWSPVKQQRNPLKSLLSEVKSPNMNQVPAANQNVEAETKDDYVGVTTVSSVKTSETHTTKDQDINKHVEEWNSPARYPIDIKKEKKGRSFWVPFVCCSSAHRDL